MQVGKQLIMGWKQRSVNWFEYIELCKTIGKTNASRKYTPLEKYIEIAYKEYWTLCYYLGIEPLTLGKWLLSDLNN